MEKLLYIEDDSTMAELISEIFLFENYAVLTDNGRNMYELIRKNTIGLILMDEQLSWCWGSSLCMELKENPDTSHIPVIMVSAARDLSRIARRCGADGYLVKPFNLDEIVEKVKHFFPGMTNNNYANS